MKWLVTLIAAALALAALRVYLTLRRRRAERREDFDARLIRQLREKGLDPFQPHELDFFFALPDETVAQGIARQLEAEGFATDMHPMREAGEGVSLHARKALRLSIEEVSALSARFAALARQNGGRYDGWIVRRGS
ncbi:MAG TPA: ribonuclease E inhibitor RraB [Steroidobacteraceae bacterium]|nr:ribonuclease E inhibitor RraB [Steroidobacteraceae bacterium]